MQVSTNDLTTFAGNDLFLDLKPYKVLILQGLIILYGII